jgi:hypothetical protein
LDDERRPPGRDAGGDINERSPMATHSSPVPAASGRSGIVTFIAVLFIVVGAFNLLDGVVALVNDDYFVADELLFGDLAAWGVWWLFAGALQLGTGLFMLARTTFSFIFAVTIAAVNMFTQLMWLGTYPGWAIAAIVVDGLILWALTTRLDEFA